MKKMLCWLGVAALVLSGCAANGQYASAPALNGQGAAPQAAGAVPSGQFAETAPTYIPPPSLSPDLPVKRPDPEGELMIADVLILRPVGVVSMAVGFVGGLLALPFAALAGDTTPVVNRMFVEPYEWTFKRPVGDVGH